MGTPKGRHGDADVSNEGVVQIGIRRWGVGAPSEHGTESTTDGPAADDAVDTVAVFLAVSECLTGFSHIELLTTGMAERYERELKSVYGGELVSRLLAEVRAVIVDAGGDEELLEHLMLARVFSDGSMLCAPAKNLVQMWYLGTLIDYTDPTPVVIFKRAAVVSAEAYRQSLVLRDAGSHPAGAVQPGFGSWAHGPRPFLHNDE
jgi:hypothetical protein